MCKLGVNRTVSPFCVFLSDSFWGSSENIHVATTSVHFLFFKLIFMIYVADHSRLRAPIEPRDLGDSVPVILRCLELETPLIEQNSTFSSKVMCMDTIVGGVMCELQMRVAFNYLKFPHKAIRCRMVCTCTNVLKSK